MKNATLRQLRIFAAVARHLSFARAAEELHLTPPAVSMQIKELESEVGLPLFDRSAKVVSLTTTGEYLLAYTRKVLATLKDAEDALARFKGLAGGQLTVGMVSTAKHWLPSLMARFRDEHPGVEMKMVLGNREQLVAAMQRGEADLAVMGRPPQEWATRAEPFALHPHVLVTAPNHPFTRMDEVPAAALQHEGFIVREPGSGTRAAMEEYAAAHHLQLRVVMEMASNETIKQAVMAGMGVSLLSLHTVAFELKHGAIATPDIQGLPLVRRWHVVNTLGKLLSPPAEAFRYFVLEHGQAHLASLVDEPPGAVA